MLVIGLVLRLGCASLIYIAIVIVRGRVRVDSFSLDTSSMSKLINFTDRVRVRVKVSSLSSKLYIVSNIG
jgi:hypothetical protein